MGKPGKTKGAFYEENNWFSLGGRLSGSDACDGAGGGISCGGYRDTRASKRMTDRTKLP